MRDQLGIELLQEVDPARRAGGDHRQRAFLQPREELVGLLDDRQVGAEVGVEHAIEAQPPQGGDHLAGGGRAGRQAEAFADGRADRRGGLHHDVHLGIGQGLPDGAGAAFFQERGRGADVDALPALDADRVVHVGQVGRADDGVEPAAVLAEVVDALDFRADAHAPAAEHALFAVADHRVAGKFDGEPLAPALEVPRAHAHRIGQVLQFAVAVALAGLAVHVVVVQQQFDDVAAGLADFGRVGLHLHPFPDLRAARGHVVAHALHVDDAHAARAGQAQVGMVAEPRDADPQLLGRLHDRRARVDLERRVVDGQGDLFLFGIKHQS